MKIADEVLEELRQGGSLSEVRTKFRSTSQVYEGLRTFVNNRTGVEGYLSRHPYATLAEARVHRRN